MAALPASLALAALVALPCLVAITLPVLAIAVLRLEFRSAMHIASVIGILLVASAMAGIVVASDPLASWDVLGFSGPQGVTSAASEPASHDAPRPR